MTDVPPPPDPRDEPYYDPRRRDDRDGGHGWQLVAVGLIALIIGVGATYLIKDDGGDTETQTQVRTVQRESQTVTVQAAPDAVTVTQPPAETVVRTTTLTVTVPTTPPETATEP